MKKKHSNEISFFSEEHKPQENWTTRIQIGTYRFKILEGIIDYFYFKFYRPKITNNALEKIKK